MTRRHVRLCRPKDWRKYLEGSFTKHFWSASLPFFVSVNARLTHRVRYAGTYLDKQGKISHSSVQYWCGNYGKVEHPSEFSADPPADRLLCEYCELRAVRAGEQPADDLVGRHVHRGRLVARRVCCSHDEHSEKAQA